MQINENFADKRN